MKSNMKMKLQFVALVTACAALAVKITPFQGWDSLIHRSPDIAIVRCAKTTDLYAPDKDGVVTEYKDGVIPSKVEVMWVLKGETNVSATYLDSWVLPRQGEYYLIFGHYHDGFYQAVEPYRIVPLGLNFSTNSIAGKGLDEQVRMLLQHRLQNLNEQMKQEQEEKQRLEEAFKAR